MKTEMNNHCGKKELLVAYLYDEVSAAERSAFESHLPDCTSCQTELQAFQEVRTDLRSWQMPFIPPIEVVTPRTALDALREFFRLVPGWFKVTSGLATAAAAALLVFALTGTRVSLGQGGMEAQFGVKEIAVTGAEIPSRQTTQSNPVPVVSRAEVEQMIQSAVAQARVEAQQQTQLQLAQMETKLTAVYQTQLQAATQRLRQEHQRRLQLELAKFDTGTRQTLSEWLLTATESGQEVYGNEKNN